MVGDIGPGNGPGVESEDETVDIVGTLIPIDKGRVFIEFGVITFLRMVLRVEHGVWVLKIVLKNGVEMVGGKIEGFKIEVVGSIGRGNG